MGKLKRKMVLVTGGSSGIGLATAILFLASDDAAYVAGEEIVVDGGTTLL